MTPEISTLRAQIEARLSQPCDTGRDQRIHDLLAKFDALFDDGHSKGCAVQMVCP